MSDSKIGSYKLVVDPFHVDFSGKLMMGVFGNRLLNCADYHATDRGFGFTQKDGIHYTWVLSRLAVEMEDMPRQYEEIGVKTWIESVYRLFTDRNFELIDKEGKTMGYVRSVWAMINMETRKPVDLLALHGENLSECVCERACPIDKPGRIKVTQETPIAEHLIKYSDIDINGHVNSIKYIEHILDLFSLDTYKEKQIKRFEMAYVTESYYGDTLFFYCEETKENEFDIEVKKNNLEVVVRSKVIFK